MLDRAIAAAQGGRWASGSGGMLHLRGDILWLQGDLEGARRSWAMRWHRRSALDRSILTRIDPSETAAGAEAPATRSPRASGTADSSSSNRSRPSSGAAEPAQRFCPLLLYDGEYAARTHYERWSSTEMLRREHSLTATALHNLADVSHKMGDSSRRSVCNSRHSISGRKRWAEITRMPHGRWTRRRGAG
jgi:hypothetical protein